MKEEVPSTPDDAPTLVMIGAFSAGEMRHCKQWTKSLHWCINLEEAVYLQPLLAPPFRKNCH